MVATYSSTPPIVPNARSRARPPATRQSALPMLATIVVAGACAAAGLTMANAYPIASPVVLGLFVAWTVFAFVRFSVALPAMLALMPITGFAPLTGWMTFEELDLLILGASAGGYAAFALRPRAPLDADVQRHGPRLSIFSYVLMALFTASLAYALQRGVSAAGGFRFGWLQGYDDPLNSLRIFKSFAWVLLMTPLLLEEVRKPGGFDRIGLGMTMALGLGSLAVLQERLAFTGLLDFSDDYRVTAPFWEMHVGGAALDGFLALTIPFAIRDALRGPVDTATASRSAAASARMAVAWVTLALAAYACLVTFSRGVYAAIPSSMLLLVVLVFRQRLGLDRRALWPLLLKGAVFGSLIALCGFVLFRSGGYRAVLAALAVLAIAIPTESSIRSSKVATWISAAVAAAILGVAGNLVAGVLPKGPYAVFALALACALATTILFGRNGRNGRNGRADGLRAGRGAGSDAAQKTARAPAGPLALPTIASWLWLAICACLVARNWGGSGAFRDCAAVLVPLVGLPFVAARMKRPVWPEKRREQLATIAFAALVMGSVAVFTAGAYMGGRFSSSRGDLDVRIAHWTGGIGRLHGADDWLFGKGLGRFPATSQFESPEASAPGSYRIVHRGGETFVALGVTKLKYLGFDELFRMSQRVSVRPRTTYQVTLRARASQGTGLHLELCEKQLLYHAGCVVGDPYLPASNASSDANGWETIRFPIQTGDIGATPWYAPRPVFFAIAAGNPNTVVEIRSIQVIGPDGVDVLANGDFSNGTARWFSSSDKYHLPWHIKNIVLDVLFDQGAIGLALFALLVGGAFLRTTFGRAFRHPDAPYVAAAIAGYLIVGAFDSLLDVPRVAFAFYLVTLLGLMLRNPRVAAPSKGTAEVAEVTAFAAVAPSAGPPTATGDDGAARARRRQRAFGERVPAARES